MGGRKEEKRLRTRAVGSGEHTHGINFHTWIAPRLSFAVLTLLRKRTSASLLTTGSGPIKKGPSAKQGSFPRGN